MKHTLAALALMALSAMPASAATFGSIGSGNDGLAPLDLGASANGYFGGQIYLTGQSDIRITILGYEAGNKNSFTFGGTTYTAGGGNAWHDTGVGNADYVGSGLFSWTVSGVAAGLLNFAFGINSGNPDLKNGLNPDVASGPYASSFFSSFLPNQNASFGSGVLFFLDEGGDKDFDDLVVRLELTSSNGGGLTPVPLPAGGLLLVGALGGLAALRRRRGAAA